MLTEIGLIITTGILAAFSPCVLILIPALLYRFSKINATKELIKEISLFALGFFLIFLITGYFIDLLSSSFIRSGFMLGIGLLFIVLGILALTNRLNPFHFPAVQNSMLYGGIFSFIITLNPCTFAYIGVLSASIHSIPKSILLFFFAIGVILPAILFSVFGQNLFSKVIFKTKKITHHLTKLMDILLILMGIYLISLISTFTYHDILVSLLFIVLIFIILIRAFYTIQKITYKNISTILLLLALIGILIATFFHCANYLPKQHNETTTDNSFCLAKDVTCEICTRCITIFSISSALGVIAILLKTYWINIFTFFKKNKQKKN